jgi:hypothetical protein
MGFMPLFVSWNQLLVARLEPVEETDSRYIFGQQTRGDLQLGGLE